MATLISAKNPVFLEGVHYVTSNFGNRTYLYNGKRVSDFHNGIDLVAKNIAADYVTAFADGTVTDTLNNVSGTVPSQGNFVTLDHKNGTITVYYQLKKGSVTIKKGDKVKKGAVLGYMGTSGNSTGPHLHFGIKKDDSWVDPLPYLLGEHSLTNNEKLADGTLCSINGARTADSLVLYMGRESTLTNKWGTEVAVDKRGVVLSSPVFGVGNMKIPKDGKVLSGHGKASKWILENVKEGDLLWFESSKVHMAKGVHRSVLFNCIREKDTLVVYDKGNHASTNPYGYEVAVSSEGFALCTPVYGKGKMEIPKGGFVLSGHGAEGEWIRRNIKKGSRLTLSKEGFFVKIIL